MFRSVVLALHITGVAAWLGANFVQLVLSPRFAKDSDAVVAAWTRQTMVLGKGYYGGAGALILITGVTMVIDGPWDWSDGFVVLGITVVLLGAALGILFFEPQAGRRADALDAGDRSSADATQRRIIPVAFLDSALVMLTILAMVHKWAA